MVSLLLGTDGLGREEVSTRKYIDWHNGTLGEHIGNH